MSTSKCKCNGNRREVLIRSARTRSFSTSFILALVCSTIVAQRPASPSLNESSPLVDISAAFLLPVKDAGLSRYGAGAELMSSYYLDRHVGIQLQADYVRANIIDYHAVGVCVGPVFHFFTRSALQPYIHALVGYSRVKDANLKPPTRYHGSGAIAGGAGVEFPIGGNWYGRGGVDIQRNWTVRTREGRGMAGLSYRFGAR